MRLVIVALLILSVLPVVEAQTSTGSQRQTCAPVYPVTATASIGSGYINFCVSYPGTVASSTSTFQVISSLTAPPTTLPVFQSTASAFAVNSGCTEGTTSIVAPSTNGVTGTVATYGVVLTMTGEQCDGSASVTLTVGATPAQIYSMVLPITVQTENQRIDNFNYLCDAPAIAPNAYSTTGTTCNDPNLALTGTLALTGIPDTQQEIQAIADALAAGLEVTICPELAPCYHVLSGSVDMNATFEMGNQTVSFPSNLTVAATFPGDVDSPGFDFWALFIFWAILLGICLYMGWWFAAGFAVPGLLDAMFPTQVPETFAVWFVFVLIGVVLEAAAAKFSWGPYKSRNRRGIMS